MYIKNSYVLLSRAFRQGKLFYFGQNTSEIIILQFHDYTIPLFWLAIYFMSDKLDA